MHPLPLQHDGIIDRPVDILANGALAMHDQKRGAPVGGSVGQCADPV
jgi:hypothetical protein